MLDELVRPHNPIVDLNTRWSGIKSLETATETLESIKQRISKLCSNDTILVGHGLENDLNVLRICHSKIIDTAAVFPHPNGLPYKYGLWKLARDHLGKIIQDSHHGHDSLEDAQICMELLHHKTTTKFCSFCQSSLVTLQ